MFNWLRQQITIGEKDRN